MLTADMIFSYLGIYAALVLSICILVIGIISLVLILILDKND